MTKSKGVLFLLVFCIALGTYSYAAAGGGGTGGSHGGSPSFIFTPPIMFAADKDQVTKGESFSLVFAIQMDGKVLKGGFFTLELSDKVQGGQPVFEGMEFQAGENGSFTFTAGEAGVSIDDDTTIFSLPLTVKAGAAPGEVSFFLKNVVLTLGDDETYEPGDLEAKVTVIAALKGAIRTFGELKSLNGISAKLVNTNTQGEQALEFTLSDGEIAISPFDVGSLDEGTYNLVVSGAGFTTWEKEFTLDKENGHTFSITSFYPGDVYGSTKQVNFHDFHALCSYMNGDVIDSAEENNSRYNIKYDLNRDGKIDQTDAAVLVQAYIAALEGGAGK